MTVQPKWYECKYCDYKTSSLFGWKIHLRVIHCIIKENEILEATK